MNLNTSYTVYDFKIDVCQVENQTAISYFMNTKVISFRTTKESCLTSLRKNKTKTKKQRAGYLRKPANSSSFSLISLFSFRK